MRLSHRASTVTRKYTAQTLPRECECRIIADNPSEHRILFDSFRLKHEIPTKNSSSLALDLNSYSQAIAVLSTMHGTVNLVE